MNTRTWTFPSRKTVLENDAVQLRAVDPEADLDDLYRAASLEDNGVDLFAYHVNVPPMADLPTFRAYLVPKAGLASEVMFRVFSRRLGRAVGCASLMNVRPDHGVVEVGSIWYSRQAQKTEVNTNAMLLLFTHVFEDLGYRRLEWKCNDRNEDSRRAARRLGFTFEGVFRQHMVSRGENRDTAWFSILDSEWPDKKEALATKARRRVP